MLIEHYRGDVRGAVIALGGMLDPPITITTGVSEVSKWRELRSKAQGTPRVVLLGFVDFLGIPHGVGAGLFCSGYTKRPLLRHQEKIAYDTSRRFARPRRRGCSQTSYPACHS